jgi:glyoxylase-like metal-dependent hydrolase (beta-lactamase superfamily II)
MQIGQWRVDPCLAGTFRLDGGAMFGVVPRVLWEKLIPPDEKNRIPMALRTLLVRGKDRVVLVDVGAGEGYPEKLASIYAFQSEGGLPGALKSLGVSAADVTDVILTHLHFDHAAGVVFPFQGDWQLAFPEATVHVQKAQWEHAMNPNPRDRASYFKDRLEVLKHERVLALHEGPWSLDEGLEILVVNGHTPGQQLLKVSDGETTLLYCGDLIPTSAHVPLPYIMAYDLEPLVVLEEKSRILEEAYRSGWILFFEHDPEVVACRVRKEGGKFEIGEKVEL